MVSFRSKRHSSLTLILRDAPSTDFLSDKEGALEDNVHDGGKSVGRQSLSRGDEIARCVVDHDVRKAQLAFNLIHCLEPCSFLLLAHENLQIFRSLIFRFYRLPLANLH